MNRCPRHKRPLPTGSIYLLTLASAVVLVAMVLGLSALIRQARRTSRTNTDIDRARIYAELGIRHALHFTYDVTNWRQILSNGKWLENVTVDQASYSLTGTDPLDGILQNNTEDPVDLTCSAALHGLSRTIEVRAQCAPSQLLAYALAAGDGVTIDGHVRINGDVFSNASISKLGLDTWIFGNAEAVGTISHTSNISGTISPGTEPKAMLDNQTILSYYQSRANPINYQPLIENVLLSPTSNPFGARSPDGLYKIDCANQKIVIKNCRIVGTLVLIKPKSDSQIEAAINWRPAQPDYPALIIDGDFTIQPQQDLDEDTLNRDFNLPGEDDYGDIDEVLPNRIQGAVYVNGRLTLDKYAKITGPVIVAGDVQLRDYAAVTADLNCYDNPPKCFREPYLTPITGTWREAISDPNQ